MWKVRMVDSSEKENHYQALQLNPDIQSILAAFTLLFWLFGISTIV